MLEIFGMVILVMTGFQILDAIEKTEQPQEGKS